MASARPGPSRRLPRGRHALEPEAAAADQRQRLYAAVLTRLAEQGYGPTTVSELATTAGISKSAFYALFSDKQDVVLAACDAFVAGACAELRARPPIQAVGSDALAKVLTAVIETVLTRPAEARFVLVDVAAAGPAGLARRRSVTAGLRELLHDATTTDGLPVISAATQTVLAGGALQIFEGHLRAGQLRRLRGAALDLAAWGALYETAHPRPLPAPDLLAGAPPAPAVSWEALPRGRHGLPPGFVARHQRLRILEAVLQVSERQGFEAASVRELIACAGLSPEAFYENFQSKEDAWAAAFDQAFVELFAAVWPAAARQSHRTAKVAAAVSAGLRFLASEPQRARLLLVDAPSAGRAGLPAIDDAMNAFARLLAPAVLRPGLPALLPMALIAGIAELTAGWVLDGDASQLPQLTAPLIELILTPALGLSAAAEAADAYTRRTDPGLVRDDRRRLMDAFAQLAARHGLQQTTMAEVAQQAGVELDAANALFEDEHDLATQALDTWASQLMVLAAGAFLEAASDPPLAAHRALQAALDHIARTPARSALAVSDDPQLAKIAAALRRRYITLFFELIAGHVAVDEQLAPEPLAALEVLVDGLLATLRRFVQDEQIVELPGTLAALSVQCLTPFFGADEALRVAEPADASPPR
jgi:AcrR family transcriptional regulator